MKPRIYINPNVPTRTSQPPVICLRGYDGGQLFEGMERLRVLTSGEMFDSYEAWEARQRWLAELRRGKK